MDSSWDPDLRYGISKKLKWTVKKNPQQWAKKYIGLRFKKESPHHTKTDDSCLPEVNTPSHAHEVALFAKFKSLFLSLFLPFSLPLLQTLSITTLSTSTFGSF
jgi:hypothetical protein